MDECPVNHNLEVSAFLAGVILWILTAKLKFLLGIWRWPLRTPTPLLYCLFCGPYRSHLIHFLTNIIFAITIYVIQSYKNVYFSHPLTKSVVKIWLIMVQCIFGTNTSCPFKVVQNGILSIIHTINKPNCWQEALILYLVSENELSKPNQFHCLEIHWLLP